MRTLNMIKQRSVTKCGFWEGEAPAEPHVSTGFRLGRSLALPKQKASGFGRAEYKQRTTTGRRGAALYAIVMSTSLIVSLLGLAALNLMRIERRSALRGQDATAARRYAQAAVEIGMLRILNDPNWRSTYTSGVWESNHPIGDGTYTLEGIDPNDGNLATPATDPVVLIGTGVMGSVRQKIQVTLVPEILGLSCLEVSQIVSRF